MVCWNVTRKVDLLERFAGDNTKAGGGGQGGDLIVFFHEGSAGIKRQRALWGIDGSIDMIVFGFKKMMGGSAPIDQRIAGAASGCDVGGQIPKRSFGRGGKKPPVEAEEEEDENDKTNGADQPTMITAQCAADSGAV